MIPKAYWWVGRPNFGDLLTPLLMAHFCQVELIWSVVTEAYLVMVGSVLEHLPTSWTGLVAGAGKLYGDRPVNLPYATFLGVRGPLTATLLGSRKFPDLCIGDPALLANELAQVEKVYDLGVVPHWSDTELEHRPEFKNFKPHVIRPTLDPIEVVREIGRCRKIVSSSLHGIIVADAFGIPRRTEMTKLFAKEGGTFKFRDHAAAVGLPFEVGLTQLAPRYIVQDRQHGIYDMLDEVKAQLKAT